MLHRKNKTMKLKLFLYSKYLFKIRILLKIHLCNPDKVLLPIHVFELRLLVNILVNLFLHSF